MTNKNLGVEGIAVRVLTPIVVPLLGMPKAPEGGQIYGGSGAEWVEIYSIETIDSLLAAKADITSVYSKAEADSIFATKTELNDLDDKVDSINADLIARLNAVEGIGGYLPAYDFGTITPTQQELTDYALSVIPNITDPSQIFNGTRVKNINNNHLWILTNTPDTVPPVFEWADNGLDSVSQADNNGTLGVVTGSNVNLKIGISSDGTMSVNGLSSALLLKVDVGTVYTKSESDVLLSGKSDLDLSNTGLISDCVLSAPNGIYSYSSGRNISIQSGLDVLIPNKRNPDRTMNSIRLKKQAASNVAVAGSAGDKITIFLNSDGSCFQTLSENIKKGTVAPDTAYEYFKNVNVNQWLKKGADGEDWTQGAAFTSYQNYSFFPINSCVFAGKLFIGVLGRSPAPTYATIGRTVITIDGKSTTLLLSTEQLSEMTVANEKMYCSKGLTVDGENFSSVSIPLENISQVIGAKNWFYCFDHVNKLAKKTADFETYIDIEYITQTSGTSISYSILSIAEDNSGNVLATTSVGALLKFNTETNTWAIFTDGSTLEGKTFDRIKFGGDRWVLTIKSSNMICSISETELNSNQQWQTFNVPSITAINTFAFGSATWAFSQLSTSVVTSNNDFETFDVENTTLTTGRTPILNFVNNSFLLTDISGAYLQVLASSGIITHSIPATADEEVFITEVLSCEISEDETSLKNIQPKYPDLFQMLGLVQMAQDIAAIKAELGL